MAFERTNKPGFSATGTPHEATGPIRGFSNPTAEFQAEAEKARQQTADVQGRSIKSIFGQRTAGSLSRQTGTARLNDLHERATKMFKASDVANSSLNLTAIKLDHVTYNVFLPAVLVVGRSPSHPEVAYVYSLLIEREDTIEPEVRTQQGGYKTVIPVVSGTAWDKKYTEAVQKAVSTALGISPENVLAFSACVVPKDLELGVSADSNVQSKGMEDLMYNACYAINTKMMDDAGENSGFVLTATAPNEIMTVEPRFGRELCKDLSGREKRADIKLTFSLKRQNSKSGSLNGKDEIANVFGNLAGYIDFISVVTEGQVNSGWGTVNQPIQKFSPLFVITSMFTEEAGSLSAHLTMLMAAATMANGDEWVNSIYERHQASKRGGESIDIGEIGGLNMEVNLPQYRPQDAQGINVAFGPIVDTRIADFDRNKYIALVQQLCRQDMFIAIDAPNVGAESWYTDIFRASASATDYGREMANKIFNTLLELTDGKFAVAFQNITKNTKLWLAEPTVIHNGYYVNHNGERRDVRDIDTLAIANILGPNDPTACSRWAATFMPGVDPERALTERKEMIEQVCGGSHNVVYTGYSTRLLLNPAVIKAMLMCAADVGFNMRFVSAYTSGFSGFGNTGFDFGGASGLSSGNVSSTFRGGQFGGNQGNVLNSNNFFGGGEGGLRM